MGIRFRKRLVDVVRGLLCARTVRLQTHTRSSSPFMRVLTLLVHHPHALFITRSAVYGTLNTAASHVTPGARAEGALHAMLLPSGGADVGATGGEEVLWLFGGWNDAGLLY